MYSLLYLDCSQNVLTVSTILDHFSEAQLLMVPTHTTKMLCTIIHDVFLYALSHYLLGALIPFRSEVLLRVERKFEGHSKEL